MLRIQLLGLFQTVKFVLFSVHNREVEQGLFIPSLRDGEGDIFEFHIDLLRHDNLFRLTAKTLPQLYDTQLQKFVIALVEFLLIFDGKTLVDGAVVHVDIIDKCHLVVAGDREDINVVNGLADHLAIGDESLQSKIFLLDFFGLLKA